MVFMAIDVCSEISSAAIISPRISFSHDLNQTDAAASAASDFQGHQHGLDSSLRDSASDFDFCIGNITFIQELSSADELFSNGKILPTQIKKQTYQPEPAVTPSRPPQTKTSNESCTEKKRLKEFLSMSLDADDDDYEKPNSSKSFWQFKRSSSLNSVSTSSKTLIRSLQFLTRSNSTGSAPNPNPKSTVKESQKQYNLKRQPSVSRKSKVSSSGTYYSYYNTSTEKPPLKKNCSGSGSHNANGVRISPVLNIPPPYISNATVSLFGFGSLFCNGKLKKKKR